MQNFRAMVSFTFDDFPSSAFVNGGRILEEHGMRGTYYTSFGLMGTVAPTGDIFRREELLQVLERGHELGCHTFDHCHAYDTTPDKFEESVLENRQALVGIAPGVVMRTLSYPISFPRPETKRRCARHFMGCRAGGQTLNIGTIDLDNLQSFFIEQSRENPEAMLTLIDENARERGWLIFSTHDVTESPTRYGCVPELFERLVKHAEDSGAQVLPVAETLSAIGVGGKAPDSSSLRQACAVQ
jgi:peptidoglycan/xylan/chitin deacetylase (PgdA/CDA1 family)